MRAARWSEGPPQDDAFRFEAAAVRLRPWSRQARAARPAPPLSPGRDIPSSPGRWRGSHLPAPGAWSLRAWGVRCTVAAAADRSARRATRRSRWRRAPRQPAPRARPSARCVARRSRMSCVGQGGPRASRALTPALSQREREKRSTLPPLPWERARVRARTMARSRPAREPAAPPRSAADHAAHRRHARRARPARALHRSPPGRAHRCRRRDPDRRGAATRRGRGALRAARRRGRRTGWR